MGTETESAKHYVKSWKGYTNDKIYSLCVCHKITCQRWLEFLESLYKMLPFSVTKKELKQTGDFYDFSEKKITDLKQAIKIYCEAGI